MYYKYGSRFCVFSLYNRRILSILYVNLDRGDLIRTNLKVKPLSQINQYTLFDSSSFSHYYCGSSAVKIYSNKRQMEEQTQRIMVSNQQSVDENSDAMQAELFLLMQVTGSNILHGICLFLFMPHLP